MIRKHYVNLTNGIEMIPTLNKQNQNYSFIRIQSTACEQKRWDFILQDLDHDFLMNLVLGNECIVYDYGANKPVSRALYQGMEWIRFVLNKRWLDKTIIPFVRGHNVEKYFENQYQKLDKKTKLKIDYFKKFLKTDVIRLRYVGQSTSNDGNHEFYREILSA